MVSETAAVIIFFIILASNIFCLFKLTETEIGIFNAECRAHFHDSFLLLRITKTIKSFLSNFTHN